MDQITLYKPTPASDQTQQGSRDIVMLTPTKQKKNHRNTYEFLYSTDQINNENVIETLEGEVHKHVKICADSFLRRKPRFNNPSC
jgi:hypothetical protein